MIFTEIKAINLLQFNHFKQENLFHFSTTIKGGVSTGDYTSLNLGMYSGDDIDNVAENKERLAQAIGVSEEDIYIPYQTHEDKILTIDDSFLSKPDLEKVKLMNGIDALITDRKNICIGVTTADCVPVLIFDPEKNILAAVHAGWKGTVAKIAAKTVAKMKEQFDCDPTKLLAGIAPCISQERFEVGEEVVDAFQQAGFIMEDIGYRKPETGKMHIDLQRANELTLSEAGIPADNIEIADLCTYSNPALFFSARRQSVHSGRMITGGVLR
ncbi:peptidoglycan editing factor PgeF [Prevotella sp. 10(H)]|uniref:peptidoglycan editing factor PgeF n=1 Tax=Prevotella sp. 10(H) TaxID=1158294 RepID=UPI0004A76449|nr:peptidoglycan editing factor PgeF [Prevotella sp. 10(H)]